MPSQTNEQRTEGRANAKQFAAWIFLSIIAVAVLQLAATHAPPQAKLLGLYLIASGLITGLAVGWLARKNDLAIGRAMASLTFVLVLCGLVFQSLESHRIYAYQLKSAYRANPVQDVVPKLPTATNDSSLQQQANLLKQLEADRMQSLTFGSYLKRRVSALGTWPFPWPHLFWAGELLLGGLAGIFGLKRAMAIEPVHDDQSSQPHSMDVQREAN